MLERRSALLSAMVATVAATVLIARPAGARAAGPAVWHVTPSANPGSQQVSDVTFASVSAAGPSEAFAVGTDQIGSLRRPLVEHSDGTSWTSMPVPKPAGRQAWLNGVVELSPTNAWAVGESSSTDSETDHVRTLIEHWDGATWSIVASPNPAVGGASGDVLTAVDGVAANDIWAVGWAHSEAALDNTLLLEHFDGMSWTVARTPSPPGSEHFANAVVTIAADDAWVVGTVALEQTLAAHWDGSRWRIVPTPSLHDGSSPINSLTGVAATATDDVWASGYEGNVGGANFMKPYALHWSGAAWELGELPNAGGEGSRLNAIVAASATDVWGAGQTQELDGSILTLTERFDGATWSIVPSPSPAGGQPMPVDSLHGVASGGGGALFAVGAREQAGQCCLRTLAIASRSG